MLVILIEHQTTNLGVRSSNLSGRANIINGLRQFRSSRRLAYSHWGAQLGAHNERSAPATGPPTSYFPAQN